MGMKELEREILAEARTVTGNEKLKMKDIMEWSTGDVKAEEGETLYVLPSLSINIAVASDNSAPNPNDPERPRDKP